MTNREKLKQQLLQQSDQIVDYLLKRKDICLKTSKEGLKIGTIEYNNI